MHAPVSFTDGAARPASDTRPRIRRLAASGAVVGVALATLFGGVAAQAATGFTEEQLAAVYDSDATTSTGDARNPDPNNWSVQMMDVFNGLRVDGDFAATGNASVMAHNEAVTVGINTGAGAAQHDRAIVDQYGDMSLTMADGLGATLGAIYADAMAAGELPKTQALLRKDGGRIGYFASTNPPKNFFDYPRPYLMLNMVDGTLVTSVEAGGKLILVDREGGDAWGSRSGAFPSGHTSQAYWQGTALATLLPELAPQILARTAEAGDNRIVMGAHWALDVISGRMMGQKIVQLRLADPAFAMLMDEASSELRALLEQRCGGSLASCIAADTPYLSTDAALAYSTEKLSYGFPLTGLTGQPFVVPAGAESLLRTSHPELTDAQRRQVLALTAIDSGHPLDVGEQEGWQRLNLAAAMAAELVVHADGSVSLAQPGSGEQPGPTDAPAATAAPGTADAPDADAPGAAADPAASAQPTAGAGADTGGDDTSSDALATTGADGAAAAGPWIGAAVAAVLFASGGALLARRRVVAGQ